MRTKIAVLSACSALLAAAMPGAGARVPGVAQGQLEHVGTVVGEAGGAASAKLIGKHLFVAHYKHIALYDVSEPTDPELLGSAPTGAHPFSAEAIDTNGKILLHSQERPTRVLQVWDVEDRASPVKIAELEGAGDHTMTCLMRCRFAYGSFPNYSVVDLRKPAEPKLLGSWAGSVQPNHVHSITEVAPGRVVVAARPYTYYLETRPNPLRPKLLAMTPDLELAGQRIMSSGQWPRRAADRFLLLTEETPFSGPCNDSSAAFMVFDAGNWKRTRTFQKLDEYRMENGTYVDGSPPANAVGCSSSFFEHHPTFRNGGVVAVSFFDHGTRLLEVDRRGTIAEIGAFLAHGGQAMQSLWIDREIVYTVDLVRGIDILRYVPD